MRDSATHLIMRGLLLDGVDAECFQIRIAQGKGSKDRHVPLPRSFRELFALRMEQMWAKGAAISSMTLCSGVPGSLQKNAGAKHHRNGCNAKSLVTKGNMINEL